MVETGAGESFPCWCLLHCLGVSRATRCCLGLLAQSALCCVPVVCVCYRPAHAQKPNPLRSTSIFINNSCTAAQIMAFFFFFRFILSCFVFVCCCCLACVLLFVLWVFCFVCFLFCFLFVLCACVCVCGVVVGGGGGLFLELQTGGNRLCACLSQTIKTF